MAPTTMGKARRHASPSTSQRVEIRRSVGLGSAASSAGAAATTDTVLAQSLQHGEDPELDRRGPGTYNIGTSEFATMRETLQALLDHAGTGSHLRSLPSAPARLAMKGLSTVGATPFAPYHWLLYGESLWFDTSHAAGELGWSSTRSNAEMVIESYEWYLRHRADLGGGSAHQSPVELGVLALLKRLK